jgi:hypothetical protein
MLGDGFNRLTIRLRARDFYAVIVYEGEARINYHLVEIESDIAKNNLKTRLRRHFLERKFSYFATRYLSRNRYRVE